MQGTLLAIMHIHTLTMGMCIITYIQSHIKFKHAMFKSRYEHIFLLLCVVFIYYTYFLSFLFVVIGIDFKT